MCERIDLIMSKKTVDNGLIKQGYLDFSKIIEKNKKEFDLNNQTQSEEKNDITIIDEPELHLHLDNDVKKYLEDIIKRQVDLKVQESINQINKEINTITSELNNFMEVLKTVVDDGDYDESNSTNKTNDILNNGLFAGVGRGKSFLKNPLKVKIMQGDKIISQNYTEVNLTELIDSLDVSSNLGSLLKEKGISQAWLAEKLDVSRNTIINFINKPSSISYLIAMKISILLEEPVDRIFPLKDNS
jgi:DNA-binding XRE family transcriptional regulator